ncbi:DNA polymerase III subunit gamma and tau [Arthrobacter sp. FW306-05-C]|uniref:DNA polymerase III subunit gamma and tau n=1 Tax=Arthrobacter sp. FW306-05-C TaxID=2879620 RepID=UPI003FA4C3AB
MSARIGRVFSVTVTTALYRRYRPDSFADVIGQEHVTEPLMTALRKNRVNHAYLFSGPRGCGKTTSARILARCLNCAQGPTDTPCGTCPSCIELARGGSGSLDVIEIDAASHGGVDDARDLRERATFAPVRDRYKIFIIDEAHMVTSAGFNALLKIVEEPPEHIKFIFATTEPDKVIGTIRSRTHHYPFRLVPPEPLMAYLELLCRQENVPVAPGVLSLVIRAGGGSVRDSLSVLDQLMAGAGPNGLDYELAVALLGYTHASLLDDVVEAIAASDSATVFRAVDRVIQTGHDPRRFVEDLLERFRDLIIVQAMPESAHAILRGMPADQIARLQNQAHNLGAAELSRAADVTNTALTEMTGATSPRLHLELLCARILLPSSEQNERGMAARIDRVERRLNYAGNDVGAPADAAPAVPAAAVQAGPTEAATAAAPAGTPAAASGTSSAGPRPAPEQASPEAGREQAPTSPAAQPAQEPTIPSMPAASAAPAAGSQSPPAAEAPRSPLTPPRVSTSDWPVEEPARARTQQGPGTAVSNHPVPEANASPHAGPASEPQDHRAAPGQASNAPATPQAPGNQAPAPQQAAPGRTAPSGPPAMGDVEVLRRAWPDVLQALSKIKRSTWALVEPNAQVSAFDGSVLTLAFTTSGLAGAFGRADHSDNLRQAIHRTVGLDCQIHAVAGGASQASSEPNPKVPASPVVPATSADIAWGLAPAPAQSASPAQAPASPVQPASPAQAPASPVQPASPAQAPASTFQQAPAPSTTSRTAPGTPDGPAAQPSERSGGSPTAGTSAISGSSGSSAVAASPATAAPKGTPAAGDIAETDPPQGVNGRGQQAPEPVQAAAGRPETPRGASGPYPGQSPHSSTGGDYSYSDDDWGPPRDEDAPPLDEEPPMDWEPSGGPANRSAPSSPAPGGRPPADGQGAGTRAHGSSAVAPRADSAAPQSANPSAEPAGVPHDPWTRAVEQAPGVWVVGDKSNVGAKPVAASGSDNIGAQATVPHYAPATAQVPPSIPVAPLPAATPGHGWDPGSVSGNGHPASATESYQASSPEPAPVPEYAMASAAPATVSPATVAPATVTPAAPARPQAPATAPAAGRTETRQSLYQRLSSSPEAEAGRAKAPARATAAPSAYVQDIPSADDETIEESGVFGRAAVERILGGKLIEERSLDGSPVPPRY